MRVRGTLRRWRFAAIDRFLDQRPEEMFVVGVLMVGALVAIVVLVFVMSPTSTVGAPPLDVRIDPERSRSEPVVRFSNQAGGYHFAYPGAWDLSKRGELSRLESPNGNIVLSFGVAPDDDLALTTKRLVRSLAEAPRADTMIGTDRQRIGGAPAFMRSGMTRDTRGAPIRYLAIAIEGDGRTYTISITVPARADPENVLVTVERIVTTFGISR